MEENKEEENAELHRKSDCGTRTPRMRTRTPRMRTRE
jgi:hypothetical protein